jgi:hypothetical protein
MFNSKNTDEQPKPSKLQTEELLQDYENSTAYTTTAVLLCPCLDPREGPENATGLFESVRLGDIASSRLKHPFPGPAGSLGL